MTEKKHFSNTGESFQGALKYDHYYWVIPDHLEALHCFSNIDNYVYIAYCIFENVIRDW